MFRCWPFLFASCSTFFFFSAFDFLWKKIKIAEVLARCFFFRCTACHIDLIKMEENNKMTDDGHSCAACDHSTAVRTSTNTNTNTKSERHEIIIIDILLALRSLICIKLNVLQKAIKAAASPELSIHYKVCISGNHFFFVFIQNEVATELKTEYQQIIITYVYCSSKNEDLVCVLVSITRRTI